MRRLEIRIAISKFAATNTPQLNPEQQKGFAMHYSTYDYLKPTDAQVAAMNEARAAAKTYGEALERLLPDGPDKTFVIRAHRSNAMWANVAITRLPDGTPRE